VIEKTATTAKTKNGTSQAGLAVSVQAMRKVGRLHNRGQSLFDTAAKMFASKGYKETTMRDIGSEICMLPSSVYYHLKLKQELLLAVYEQAVNGIKVRLANALAEKVLP
jgi:AcrR family transcriptional regulator